MGVDAFSMGLVPTDATLYRGPIESRDESTGLTLGPSPRGRGKREERKVGERPTRKRLVGALRGRDEVLVADINHLLPGWGKTPRER